MTSDDVADFRLTVLNPGGRDSEQQFCSVPAQPRHNGAIGPSPIVAQGWTSCVNTFWKRARELATKHGAALIADEIQCGMGRTGRAFAYQRLTGLPDIVVVAKPLAGGLPLGAFLAREEFAAAFSPGAHGRADSIASSRAP